MDNNKDYQTHYVKFKFKSFVTKIKTSTVSNNMSVMPLDVLGCIIATMKVSTCVTRPKGPG